MSVVATALAHLVECVRSQGGGTFDSLTLAEVKPQRGCAVSFAGTEESEAVDRFSSSLVERYIAARADFGLYLGLCVDGGRVYLDLSEIVDDIATALVRAAVN